MIVFNVDDRGQLMVLDLNAPGVNIVMLGNARRPLARGPFGLVGRNLGDFNVNHHPHENNEQRLIHVVKKLLLAISLNALALLGSIKYCGGFPLVNFVLALGLSILLSVLLIYIIEKSCYQPELHEINFRRILAVAHLNDLIDQRNIAAPTA